MVSATVKETLPVVVLPEASLTVTVMVCCPRPRLVPATGFCVITRALAGVQLSLATTLPITLGTVPWQLASEETVIGAGRLTITGGMESATVKETLPVTALPEASFTVTTMVCWPRPRIVPATGLWVMTRALAGVQLSLATTPPTTLGAVPWQLASEETVIGVGRLTMVGGVVSATVRETFPVVVLPEASFTVTTMVCWPRSNVVPATGFWVMARALANVQLSLATTLPTTLGTAPWQLTSEETVIGAGRLVIAGAVVSATVKESVPLAGFPAASATV